MFIRYIIALLCVCAIDLNAQTTFDQDLIRMDELLYNEGLHFTLVQSAEFNSGEKETSPEIYFDRFGNDYHLSMGEEHTYRVGEIMVRVHEEDKWIEVRPLDKEELADTMTFGPQVFKEHLKSYELINDSGDLRTYRLFFNDSPEMHMELSVWKSSGGLARTDLILDELPDDKSIIVRQKMTYDYKAMKKLANSEVIFESLAKWGRLKGKKFKLSDFASEYQVQYAN